MTWVTEFRDLDTGVELQRRKRVGDSPAESAYRVRRGSRLLYLGWAQDAYAEYKRLVAVNSA